MTCDPRFGRLDRIEPLAKPTPPHPHVRGRRTNRCSSIGTVTPGDGPFSLDSGDICIVKRSLTARRNVGVSYHGQVIRDMEAEILGGREHTQGLRTSSNPAARERSCSWPRSSSVQRPRNQSSSNPTSSGDARRRLGRRAAPNSD